MGDGENAEKGAKEYRGILVFRLAHQGSKSEALMPFLERRDADPIALYFPGDNPYENETLVPFENRKCAVVCSESPTGSAWEVFDIREIDDAALL